MCYSYRNKSSSSVLSNFIKKLYRKLLKSYYTNLTDRVKVYNRTETFVNNHPVYANSQNHAGFTRFICFRADVGWVLVKKIVNNCEVPCGIDWYFPADRTCLEGEDSLIGLKSKKKFFNKMR